MSVTERQRLSEWLTHYLDEFTPEQVEAYEAAEAMAGGPVLSGDALKEAYERKAAERAAREKQT